ncbi:hypothetical protein CYY_000610 [Polysphondylium violaceum]|uniref:Myb transcription factor n=1 Tax=Polysphondylium violaceum TaxID=133409 RepID=A0A8J4VBC6_9MYCE|nr:hypothetical protein CYY_000610 [Polysphondylium violaceum]
MINPNVYPVSQYYQQQQQHQQQYCGSNNNSNNNSQYSNNHNYNQNNIQDVRVPDQFCVGSPVSKKRSFNTAMSPPTPNLLSNSPYIHSSHGNHIVPQYSPQPLNGLQFNNVNTPIMNNNSFFNSTSEKSTPIMNQNNTFSIPNGNNNLTNSSNNIDYGQSPSNSYVGGIESPPSMELNDEDAEEQLREYISPVLWSMMDNYARDMLYNAIVDFINEEISFRSFLLELRVIAVMDVNYKSIFQFLVDLFLSIEPSQKMVNYLKDNGVEENEFNIDVKSLESMSENDSSQKKKRERIRKSVSRGLRNPPNKWTKEESQKLIQLVHEHGDKQWKKIAHQIGGGKTGAQCAQHWKRVLCPAIRKGSWDEDEESKLFSLVEKHGQSWKNVASEIRTRTDIQCRYQYFKSCMSREVQWSQREDEILQKKVMENKQEGREINWMDVSKAMARGRQTKIPRTALECKTRFEQITYGGPPIQIIQLQHDEIQQHLQSPSLNSLLQDQNCF